MRPNRAIHTLLSSTGWVFAGIAASALLGIALLVLVMMLSNSEAVGQGMILIGAWMILVPVGVCIGFTHALFAWERRNALRQELPSTSYQK
ncbi:high-affinity Fe2+/Pb2+ permease [Granulicella aggregans]|uniref:High-affinity Fe2+/Pb2+ permease n=1 Tax=Granulicella aggregans TaxID=474949 RepID=A0A7W7ZHA5_9BACT|nr:high-affinity Fe2+/Pb2+ permease [Granulicella aggregans]